MSFRNPLSADVRNPEIQIVRTVKDDLVMTAYLVLLETRNSKLETVFHSGTLELCRCFLICSCLIHQAFAQQAQGIMHR